MSASFSKQRVFARILIFTTVLLLNSACNRINDKKIDFDNSEVDVTFEAFKVMTFNIRHGCGRQNWGNTSGSFFRACGKKYDEIIAAIRSADPDVVGLQEVNDGQAEIIARALNMNYIYESHNSFGYGNWWGNAVITKYKVLSSERIKLGGSGGRNRSMVTAIADVPGGAVAFASIHTDHRISDERSINRILEYSESIEMPVILIGDFNMMPDSAGIRSLLYGTGFTDSAGRVAKENLGTWDSPSGRRIDYVFVQSKYFNVLDVALVDKEHHSVSDHLAYYATVSATGTAGDSTD